MSEISAQVISLLGTLCWDTQTDDSDSARHLMTLFGLALGRKGRRYLELGVRDGNTTRPLLLAAYLNGATLTSVDRAPSPFEPPGFLKASWIFVREEAWAYLHDQDNDMPLDIVFVDDDHDGEHVARELAELDRLVSPRSLILLHDTMYGQAPCYHSDPHSGPPWSNGGPYGALASLSTNIWEWATVPYGHGLTLLRKKYSTRYHSLEDEA